MAFNKVSSNVNSNLQACKIIFYIFSGLLFKCLNLGLQVMDFVQVKLIIYGIYSSIALASADSSFGFITKINFFLTSRDLQ